MHILLAYFHLRGRNRFAKLFPISFEMWLVGVQEMHEGREAELLPIQLGRRPSSSKPTMGLIATLCFQTRYSQQQKASTSSDSSGIPVTPKCLPTVTHLFPSCLSDVPTCHPLSRVCLADVALPLSRVCQLSRDVSRLSSACSSQRPLVSQMWFSLVSQLPPRCDLPIISHLCPLALNLEPSLLLVCKAGLMNCSSKMLNRHLQNVQLC